MTQHADGFTQRPRYRRYDQKHSHANTQPSTRTVPVKLGVDHKAVNADSLAWTCIASPQPRLRWKYQTPTSYFATTPVTHGVLLKSKIDFSSSVIPTIPQLTPMNSPHIATPRQYGVHFGATDRRRSEVRMPRFFKRYEEDRYC